MSASTLVRGPAARVAPGSPLPRLALTVLPLAVGVLALAALPYVAGPYEQQVGYRVLQLAALATAWNLLAGFGGMVSLGSAAFVGLGVYTATEVGNRTALPLPVLLVLGGVAGAGFAALASPAMFRLRGLYFTVGTLALASALQILFIDLRTFGGAAGRIVDTVTPPDHVLYWYALALALLSTAVVVGLLSTPASLSLRAVRDDEPVARTMGVRTYRTKLWAFAVCGALVGAVGALQAVKLGSVEPYGAFSLTWTIDIVSATIIGGLGTRAGPWVGAVLYVLLAEALKDYPEVHVALTGVVLLVVVRFAPRGVWGTLAARWPGARRG